MTKDNFNNFKTIQNQYNTKTKEYVNNFKNIIEQIKKISNPYWQVPTLFLEKTALNFVRNYS
jgi:hypothetical protein